MTPRWFVRLSLRGDQHTHAIATTEPSSGENATTSSRLLRTDGTPAIGNDCCARATTGHATAPPRAAMNSRRLICGITDFN